VLTAYFVLAFNGAVILLMVTPFCQIAETPGKTNGKLSVYSRWMAWGLVLESACSSHGEARPSTDGD
jgi:hypothetical protein